MHALSLGATEFEGHNDAHLLDGGTVTLVDTGIATPETERQLRACLGGHAGLAGTIQRESGATVDANRRDALLVRQSTAVRGAKAPAKREQLERWGMLAGNRAGLREWLDVHGLGAVEGGLDDSSQRDRAAGEVSL